MTSTTHRKDKRGSGIGRRRFLAGAASAAGVLAAPNIIRSAQAQGKSLTIAVWGGDWSEAVTKYYIEPFMRDTGIEVNTISPISFAKLRTMAETGNYEYDITTSGFPTALNAKEKGYLEPVHWNVVDEGKLGPADGPTGWQRCVEMGGLGSHLGAWVLAYREDDFDTPPTGWQDFWNTEGFPQDRMLYNAAFPTTVMWEALLGDGLPVSQAGGAAGWDEERAYRALNLIKPHVKAWWKFGNQSMQLIGDREVSWGTMSNARVNTLRNSGRAPVKTVWNGAQMFEGVWIVPKGTPNAEAAWQFAAYATAAENVGRYCSNYESSPMNVDAYEHIPEEKRPTLEVNPDNLKQAYFEDPLWLAPLQDDVLKRFSQWFAG